MKRVAVVCLAGVFLAGCSDPYAHRVHSVAPPTPRRAQPADAAPAAARQFAARWINWDWRFAASQQRALAAMAGGHLAADLRANAASARIDASLAQDKPSVRGVVAIVDLSPRGVRSGGLVVTREQSYTAGRPDLGGRRYRVYAIALARRGGHWDVTAWQPQP